MEQNTNLSDNTQHNPLQIPKLSCSEISTGKIPSSSVELQQQISEFYSSEQTQTTAERLRVQHQGRIEAANQILQNQDLEGNQLIQQLNQLDTKNQQDYNPSEKIQLIPSTSKEVLPQQVARSEFSIPRPFVFHVITKRQKRAFIADATNFSENLIYNFSVL